MEFWFYVIWATLAVVTLFVGGIYLYSRNEEKKRHASKTSTPVAAPVTAPAAGSPNLKKPIKPVESAVDNALSEDRRFADAHDLWVCAYCETLNKCPPHMIRKRPEVHTPRPSSTLKGAMARKPVTGPVAVTSERIACVACGKYLDGVS